MTRKTARHKRLDREFYLDVAMAPHQPPIYVQHKPSLKEYLDDFENPKDRRLTPYPRDVIYQELVDMGIIKE